MYAAAPLYSEHFDADVALKHNMEMVFYAKSHSKNSFHFIHGIKLTIIDDLYAEPEKFFDYRGRLHLITAKSLVIVGGSDWICPPEQSKDISMRIPGARLEIIENANHGVHLEKNAEVIKLIKEHLA
jgi:pimeloyl-ACP methyl ester carboxylesterase